MTKTQADAEIIGSACACSMDSSSLQLDRRRWVQLFGGALAASALLPSGVFGDSKGLYEALVLSCIDPRYQKVVNEYLKENHLVGRYSQVTIAGAAIGAVAPRFDAWHSTFWENLSISLALHRIGRVIVVQHRDCGAARDAYGHFEPDAEVRIHRAAVAAFREELDHRHPQLKLEALLMNEDGSHQPLD